MDSTKLLVFFFIGFGFTSCSASYNREYHYVTQPLTWTEAQKYCREKYTDLATFDSAEDLSRLNRPSGDTSFSWIGLSDDPKSWKAEAVWNNDSNSWRWSATGKTSETGYHNWDYVNYEQYRYRTCGYIWSTGQWYDESCSNKFSSVCFKDSNPPGKKTFTVVTNPMNWTEAQAYCRTHHTDLATIDNTEENTQVHSVLKGATYVWIGLYRIPWRWSDSSNSYFTNWKSGEPSEGNDYCVAVDSQNFWHDLSCSVKHNFWCHTDDEGKKTDDERKIEISNAQPDNDEDMCVKTMVRMKIQTFADLSDPATNAQILQQLSERFKALHGDVKLRWVTQPRKQVEDDDEDDETCN